MQEQEEKNEDIYSIENIEEDDDEEEKKGDDYEEVKKEE